MNVPRGTWDIRGRAARELYLALSRYGRLASRPRSADAWAAIVMRLWNARQNAVYTGALLKRYPDDHALVGELTDAYRFVSDCLDVAVMRAEAARDEECRA